VQSNKKSYATIIGETCTNDEADNEKRRQEFEYLPAEDVAPLYRPTSYIVSSVSLKINAAAYK
jgi:hypothetical protein